MAVAPTSLGVNDWDPTELGVPQRTSLAPGASGSETRTREIHGAVGEQREMTRKYLSELLADVLDTVFEQHRSYSKETLCGKN